MREGAKAKIRNANNVHERNTCVLCAARSDTCVLYAARFLLFVDVISTSKSSHKPHRFDSSVFLSLSLSRRFSISLYQGLDSSLRRAGSLILRLKDASHVHPKLVRAKLPPRIVEIT